MNLQITGWCSHFISQQVKPGALCVDATAGNGNDTLLLCRLAGARGKVLAFDIQPQALEKTAERLRLEGVAEWARLILDSHVRMSEYLCEGTVDFIVFNFGYLPGGDHRLATQAGSSVAAVQSGLKLLKKKGAMSLCIYSGGDTGYEEKEALLTFLQGLDPKKYLVIVSQYYNRPNDPPIPVFLTKL